VPGGVDQVEFEVLPGPAGVWQGDGVALDGNAPFTLQIHSVQDLVPEIPVAYESGVLDKAISQGGLAVIDVGDDAKVAGLGHSSLSSTPEDRAASIAGEFDHLSYSGEEVNQDENRSFPIFSFWICRSTMATIWCGQSKLLAKPA
jgi:hypothetical protein